MTTFLILLATIISANIISFAIYLAFKSGLCWIVWREIYIHWRFKAEDRARRKDFRRRFKARVRARRRNSYIPPPPF